MLLFPENWIKPNEALQLGGKEKIGIGRWINDTKLFHAMLKNVSVTAVIR